MKLQPVGSKLMVKAIEEDAATKAGIILPESAKEKPQKGKVLAVGPGKVLDSGEREAIDVKVGDTVWYTKYGPTEIQVEGKEYLMIDYSDVLAVEKKK